MDARLAASAPGHIVLNGDPAPLPKMGTPPILAHVCCGQTAGWIRCRMVRTTEVSFGPGDIVLDEDQLPSRKRRGHSTPPNFRPTYYGQMAGWTNICHLLRNIGLARPRRYCVSGRRSRPPPKGAKPTIFGPCLLWPNGWMDQDATWYGGRPRPWLHCDRWGPSPSQRHTAPQFSAHVSCDKMAGWIEMPLGTNVGHIVLDGDQFCPFSAHVYCSQTVAHLSYCSAHVTVRRESRYNRKTTR